jgi:hypothetical protein
MLNTPFFENLKDIMKNTLLKKSLTALVCALLASAGTAYAATPHHTHAPLTKKFAGKKFFLLPQKTNGSGVTVYENKSNKPALNSSTTLTLKIAALSAGSTGEIKVLVPEGLSSNTREVAQTLGENASTLKIVFTPKTEGLHYIQIFTRQGDRTTAAEIAIQVGNAVQKPAVNGTLVTGSNGEKIIEMKAQ